MDSLVSLQRSFHPGTDRLDRSLRLRGCPRVLAAAGLLAVSAGIVSARAQDAPLLTPYGCGVNPAESLVLLGGTPSIGDVLTLGVDDPTGGQAPGSAAVLLLSVLPDFAYPCGLVLPGFGMGPGPGELLIGLIPPNPALTLGPVIWTGPGQPAAFAIGFPTQPVYVGKTLYFQGAMVDPSVPNGIGLTEGLEGVVYAAGPDLWIRAASPGPIAVAPGETVTVTAVVKNRGSQDAQNVLVEACDGGSWCGSVTIPSIASTQTVVAAIPLVAVSAHLVSNPHFFTVSVDSQGTIAETDEGNNVLTAHQPAFVVQPVLVAPALEDEHDDYFEVQNGATIVYQHTNYGPDNSPSDTDPITDPYKGQPDPETGYTEPVTWGVLPQPRIEPTLVLADAALAPGETLVYLVKYVHQVPMPRLPDLSDKTDRFSAINVPIHEQRLSMLEGVRLARLAAATPLVGLVEGYGGVVLEHFLLSGSMRIEAPKGLLALLDAEPQVQHVEAESLGELPPADIEDGRDWINSDPYFDGGAEGEGYIALLDTGIWTDHDLFNNPDHIDFMEDCVNGDSDCDDAGDPDYDPDDDCWDHGTKTAGIVTGNKSHGDSYRGVTSATVDNWKVYPEDCGGLSTTAVLRAYDQAVYYGDKIIIAEMQSGQGHSGSIATAADDAFDAGHCTIAANGNNGPGEGTVNSPANAHKALGVGNYDAGDGDDINSQSDGPTSDDRYKPDLQAPTNTKSSSNEDDDHFENFGGTSGATPYAAGAASVFADWFGLSGSGSASAGKIYAGLINAGPLEWGDFNNEEGVGKFALHVNGHLWYGSRNVSDGENEYVTIDVPDDADEIAATIWWPEDSDENHSDIDLYILEPDGSKNDWSTSVPGVFEHVWGNPPFSEDEWKIRIHGYDVPDGKTVTVYFAVHVR